jgi:hypothetical protein
MPFRQLPGRNGVQLLALRFDTTGLHAFFCPPCAVYIRPNTLLEGDLTRERLGQPILPSVQSRTRLVPELARRVPRGRRPCHCLRNHWNGPRLASFCRAIHCGSGGGRISSRPQRTIARPATSLKHLACARSWPTATVASARCMPRPVSGSRPVRSCLLPFAPGRSGPGADREVVNEHAGL